MIVTPLICVCIFARFSAVDNKNVLHYLDFYVSSALVPYTLRQKFFLYFIVLRFSPLQAKVLRQSILRTRTLNADSIQFSHRTQNNLVCATINIQVTNVLHLIASRKKLFFLLKRISEKRDFPRAKKSYNNKTHRYF